MIWCYWAADAPDPNGSGFQWGSSASLKSKGEEVNVADVAMGDIAFYGDSRTDIDHVTVYVGNGRCISHGVESGPLLQRPLNYNGRLQSVRTYPL